MNCTVHPESAATAYCRTCGKAMCDACKRTVHGVIYCEDCLAHRVGQPIYGQPTSGAPSPGLAALLGFIPGVGAMYNGQFVKGLIHVVVFAVLIGLESAGLPDGADAFIGLMIAFWYFYMIVDAYKTAKAKLYGLPLPDPFGIERSFGGPNAVAAQPPMVTTVPPPPPPGAPGANAGSTPGVPANPYAQNPYVQPVIPNPYVPSEPMYALPPHRCRQASPAGAIVLIAIGVLFLLNTLGWWQFHWIGRMWPLILIGIGVWLFSRRMGPGGQPGPQAPPPPANQPNPEEQEQPQQ